MKEDYYMFYGKEITVIIRLNFEKLLFGGKTGVSSFIFCCFLNFLGTDLFLSMVIAVARGPVSTQIFQIKFDICSSVA